MAAPGANGVEAAAIVPVGEARTVLPAPDLGEPIDTQTRAIGVIYPPPDIRAIVDKTAQFVARNGVCCGRRGAGHAGQVAQPRPGYRTRNQSAAWASRCI